jgi:CCR4-NOT transcription complex subunit 10
LGKLYFGCPLTPIDSQNQIALYIKADLEYFKKNFRKSLKLLENCRSKDREDEAHFYNNVGCIYFKLQRYNAALLYFEKAFQKSEARVRNQQLCHSYITDIAYNYGLCLLMTSRPDEALNYFNFCSNQFSKRPHLWIRVAECYLRCSTSYPTSFSLFEIKSISSGRSTRFSFLRPDNEMNNNMENSKRLNENNILKARECVLHSLRIISDQRKEEEYEHESYSNKFNYESPHGNVNVLSSKDESDGQTMEEMSSLKLDSLEENCMLLLLYVHLELSDHVGASSLAKSILLKGTLSEKNKFVVELMLCEALCLSGRINEATAILDIFSNQDTTSPPLSYISKDLALFGMHEGSIVTTTVSLYRAIQYICAGKLEQAQTLLEKLFRAMPNSEYVMKALLYCHLKNGGHSSAINLLRFKRRV